MKLDLRTLLLACIVTFLVATYASPLRPDPEPQPRPFLTAVAKLAKAFLWLAFVTEPPEDMNVYDAAPPSDSDLAINHARSL